MSTQLCGCQCPAIDTVPAYAVVPSQGMTFDLAMDTPEPLFTAPMLILALVTAALTLAHQKRRYVPPSNREEAPAPVLPAMSFEWKLRLSPAERRFLAWARMAFRHSDRDAITRAHSPRSMALRPN